MKRKSGRTRVSAHGRTRKPHADVVTKFITRAQMLAEAHKRVYVREVTHRVNLGDTLNRLIGDGEGLPDGTIIEIAGDSGAGKSTTTLDLAAAAQADGMTVCMADFENSLKRKWAQRRGVDTEDPLKFEHFPYDAIEKLSPKGKVVSVQFPTVEEIFDDIERYIRRNVKLNPERRFLVLCDSIAAMATDAVSGGDIADSNMRTKMDLPSFMSQLMKKWIRFTASHAVTLVFVNQLRVKPGVMFGDPSYTPGGNAVPFFSHVRVRLKRIRLLRKDGKPCGVCGIMKLVKSKIGGMEGTEVGYKLLWRTGRTKFVPVASLFVKKS